MSASRVDEYIDRQLQIGPRLMANKATSPAGIPYFDRAIKSKIAGYIEDFGRNPGGSERWLIMPGLRGVGKTTVLAQTYLHLRDKPVRGNNLLYLSADDCVNELRADLATVLEAYSRRLGQSWVYLDQPTFILIDEIQEDPKWATSLKSIYEKTNLAFFVCTGSSAVALQVGPNAARRSQIERLYPLSFSEYQLLANNIPPAEDLKLELIDAIYYSDSAGDLEAKLKHLAPRLQEQWLAYDSTGLDRYLARGTMPSSLAGNLDDFSFWAKLRRMIDQTLADDLHGIRQFDQITIANIKHILFLLSDTSSPIKTNTLNQLLKTTSSQIQAIFDALTKAEILIKVPAWGDHFASTRKPPRYFFMSPAIRLSYQSLVLQPAASASRRGQLLEDLAALHYYREFSHRGGRGQLTYLYDKDSGSQAGCDFILKLANSHQLAIEFGVGSKTPAQVERTMAKTDCRYGIVFADNPLSLSSNGRIVTIPLNYFYLI